MYREEKCITYLSRKEMMKGTRAGDLLLIRTN